MAQGVESIIKSIQENPFNMAATSDLSNKSILAANVLGSIFIIIAIAYGYLKPVFSGQNKSGQFVDIGYISQAILKLILISSVPAILIFFNSVASYLADIFILKGSVQDTLTSMYDSMMNLQVEGQKVSETSSFNIFDSISVGNFLLTLFFLFTTILTFIIKLVILFLTSFLIQFLYVVAPLAIAFSILPGFEGIIQKFLGSYLSAIFIVASMNIVDRLVLNQVASSFFSDGTGTNEMQILAATGYCSASILMYCIVFYLTGLYTGGTGAGKVVSMATTMAMVALSSGTMIASKGASSMASAASKSAGSSGTTAATNVGKDVLNAKN